MLLKKTLSSNKTSTTDDDDNDYDYYYYYYAHSHKVGALYIDGIRPSVCLSVPCLTLSRELKSVVSWKLAGRKPMTWATR